MERQLAPSAQWHMAATSHEHSLRSGRLTDGESISPSVGCAGRLGRVLPFVFYSPEKLALARATFAYVLFMGLHIIILFNL